MKRILIVTLLITTLLCLSGCTELICTETQKVEATIIDVYYSGAWTQTIFTGKTIIIIPHPARYEITFTYNNVALTVDDEEIYNRYKDKIGDTAECILITEYYDSGSTYQTLKLKEIDE